jgi:hypothetical protein
MLHETFVSNLTLFHKGIYIFIKKVFVNQQMACTSEKFVHVITILISGTKEKVTKY